VVLDDGLASVSPGGEGAHGGAPEVGDAGMPCHFHDYRGGLRFPGGGGFLRHGEGFGGGTLVAGSGGRVRSCRRGRIVSGIRPLKQWKLSPVDLASLDKWDDYTAAKEAMFFNTDTADAPWTVVKSDCKKRARLNALRYVLHKLPYARKDPKLIGPVDPLLVGRANVVYERGENADLAIL
jgi:hypothetical protein